MNRGKLIIRLYRWCRLNCFVVWILLLLLFIGLRHDTVQALAEDRILVGAAASLTDVLTQVGHEFEISHKTCRVMFNFAASGALVQQLNNGAPADVLVTADVLFMTQAQNNGSIYEDTRQNLVRNVLVLIVPANRKEDPLADPALVREFLEHRSQKIAIGNPGFVPAGKYAKQALQRLEIFEALSDKYILCNSVRQVLNYVQTDEVDAGFVYLTDAKIAGRKVSVLSRLTTQKEILYQIAVSQKTKNKSQALAFIQLATSSLGQAIFAKFGFEPPGGTHDATH